MINILDTRDKEELLQLIGSSGGGSSITVDDALSTTSTNPVQNKVITNALSDYATKEDLENFDNAVELTKAEYDALPDTKLTNDTTYFVKDMEIPSGSGEDITIDSALSETSTNPVQNKVITKTLSDYATKEDLENFDNSMELTKAEYDALPDDKLTDDINYFITDINPSSGGSGDGSAIYDGDGNEITSTYAKKSIYDNNAISYGRKVGSAIGEGSIAFGLDVEAPINYGVAVGAKTRAGDCAFACGHTNSANGLCSSALGFNTTVDGEYSHVEGVYTKASSNCQHVQGKYNEEDTEHKYAHIIGGGNSETDRKNIHTIDWNGNADFAGEVKCSNVLKTLTECEASTKDTDIAGASALAEMSDFLDTKTLINSGGNDANVLTNNGFTMFIVPYAQSGWKYSTKIENAWYFVLSYRLNNVTTTQHWFGLTSKYNYQRVTSDGGTTWNVYAHEGVQK